MFNFFKGLDYIAEAKRLECEVGNLTKENGELRRVINEMKADYAKQQKQQIEEASRCDFEIDFDGAKIASIEREVRKDGVEVTSFGRMNGNGGINCDFYFYCS